MRNGRHFHSLPFLIRDPVLTFHSIQAFPCRLGFRNGFRNDFRNDFRNGFRNGFQPTDGGSRVHLGA